MYKKIIIVVSYYQKMSYGDIFGNVTVDKEHILY